VGAYARRYGVDRYTAYGELTAVGFPVPASAQKWAGVAGKATHHGTPSAAPILAGTSRNAYPASDINSMINRIRALVIPGGVARPNASRFAPVRGALVPPIRPRPGPNRGPARQASVALEPT